MQGPQKGETGYSVGSSELPNLGVNYLTYGPDIIKDILFSKSKVIYTPRQIGSPHPQRFILFFYSDLWPACLHIPKDYICSSKSSLQRRPSVHPAGESRHLASAMYKELNFPGHFAGFSFCVNWAVTAKAERVQSSFLALGNDPNHLSWFPTTGNYD